MNERAFAVHLGGGLYLDSDGNLHQGEPPAMPVYEAPFKLPIDLKKARDAIKGVQKALKDVNRDPEVLRKFAEYGFDTKILDVLAGIGKIAGVIAPVFAVAAVAYDILKLFGLFKEGPSALELLVKQRFDELEDNVESIKVLIQTKDLRDGRLRVEEFLGGVKDYTDQFVHVNPSPAELEADRARMFDLHDEKVGGVSLLLDKATWIGNFDREEHTRVWPLIQHVVHTMPDGPGRPPVRATFPADDTLHFDHRLMVPLASYAATSYLACIRGMVPEHRSSGDFRERLRGFALKLDDLAHELLRYGLGRTFYTAQHFAYPVMLAPHEVEWTGVLPGLGSPRIARNCGRWPVGAFDLRFHGDLFFAGFLNGLFRAEFLGYDHPTRHGGLEFRWIPPARLEPSAFGNFQIANPEECAAAANARSETDYADLLSMSGYTELVRLAALFRSESTEPDRSQTVVKSKPLHYRTPLPSTTVTVKSEPFMSADIITASAKREPQQCMSTVRLRTQPIKRARPATYTVRLRTLASILSNGRWREPSYDQYQRPDYVTDADRRFKRLDLLETDASLGAVELVSGSTPRDAPVSAEGVVELDAHTFDWWIPVQSPLVDLEEIGAHLGALRAANWNGLPQGRPDSLSERPMRTLSDDGATALSWRRRAYTDLLPELIWKNQEQDWDGEHRMPEPKRVRIEYRLDWVGDRLSLTVSNDPVDRNYVIYLVLEEKLPASGRSLHTAVPIPINGQLTYVPQKFFDDERKEYEEAIRTVTRFNERYLEQREPGPIDPIIGWMNPADLVSRQGLARFFTAAREHAPDLLGEVVTEIRLRRPVM
ncbi:MAG: hypothetical protein RLO50_07635 [Azospirillaceae bacterium]